MAGFVVRSGSEETPRWCFRPRFLGFLTLLLVVLAHSTSAGVLGTDRTNDTDTQEARYDHTLNGDGDKYHYQNKHDYDDIYQHGNASLDDIVPEAYTDNNRLFRILLWVFFVILIACLRGAHYACSKYKDNDGARARSRVILIRQHIPVPVEDPAASQTRCDRDSGATTTPSPGTEDSTDDAPPPYSAICPETSRAPQ